MFKIGDKVRFVRTVSDKCQKGVYGHIKATLGATYEVRLPCGYITSYITPSMIEKVDKENWVQVTEFYQRDSTGKTSFFIEIPAFSCCSTPNIITNTAAGQAFRVCKSCLFDHGDIK